MILLMIMCIKHSLRMFGPTKGDFAPDGPAMHRCVGAGVFRGALARQHLQQDRQGAIAARKDAGNMQGQRPDLG